jgi:hypothetical protein
MGKLSSDWVQALRIAGWERQASQLLQWFQHLEQAPTLSPDEFPLQANTDAAWPVWLVP